MDTKYMKRAIELAKKGAGYVSPNPMVGAVIVKNGRIIGEGWHMKYGFAHAEANALANASEDTSGSELYVTLEPCSHYGHTPPCAKAIIEHNIKKVYIGTLDVNPLVAGNGVKMLQDAGIEVVTGVMEDECKSLNTVFFKYMTTGMPYVLMKTAMTLDGKIATYTGSSKWVSNDTSRHIVHRLRHNFTAIMVGINTVIADDPRLTCRINGGIDPVRIIVDSNLKIPLNANVLDLNNNSRCIIATTKESGGLKKSQLKNMGAEIIETSSENNRVNLKELMHTLGKMKIDSILLEGGGTLNYSMLESHLIDKVLFFISPKVIGGASAPSPVGGKGIALMSDAINIDNVKTENINGDILIYGDVR